MSSPRKTIAVSRETYDALTAWCKERNLSLADELARFAQELALRGKAESAKPKVKAPETPQRPAQATAAPPGGKQPGRPGPTRPLGPIRMGGPALF